MVVCFNLRGFISLFFMFFFFFPLAVWFNGVFFVVVS